MEGTDVRTNGGAAHRAGAGLGIPEPENFPEVREKTQAWRAATERFRACEEKVKRAREDRNKPPASMEERAQASLRGESIPASSESREDLAALFDERQVLGTAANLAKASLDKAVGAASAEVCKRLSASHRERVKTIASCAIALQEAIEAEENLEREIRARGFNVTAPIAEFPRCPVTRLGTPGDQNSPLGYFLKALRARGLEV